MFNFNVLPSFHLDIKPQLAMSHATNAVLDGYEATLRTAALPNVSSLSYAFPLKNRANIKVTVHLVSSTFKEFCFSARTCMHASWEACHHLLKRKMLLTHVWRQLFKKYNI